MKRRSMEEYTEKISTLLLFKTNKTLQTLKGTTKQLFFC